MRFDDMLQYDFCSVEMFWSRGKWADQFEALDEHGTGQIKVSDLVEKVAQQSGEGAASIKEARLFVRSNTLQLYTHEKP